MMSYSHLGGLAIRGVLLMSCLFFLAWLLSVEPTWRVIVFAIGFNVCCEAIYAVFPIFPKA